MFFFFLLLPIDVSYRMRDEAAPALPKFRAMKDAMYCPQHLSWGEDMLLRFLYLFSMTGC